MLIIALIITSFIVSALIPLFPDITTSLLKCIAVVYTSIAIVDIFKTKRISIQVIWIVAFIYIIWSEMLILSINDSQLTYMASIFYYLMACNAVLLGYQVFNWSSIKKVSLYEIRDSNTFLIVLILLTIYYLYSQYEAVFQTLIYGRILSDVTGGTDLADTFAQSLGMILPSLIAYYFKFIKKASIWYAILLVAPIIIYQGILATRFKLLFQILPFLIIIGAVRMNNISLKSTLLLILSAYAITSYSTFTKENRNSSLVEESFYGETEYINENNNDIAYRAASEMSPEGIIAMTYLSDKYYEDNPHGLGKETSYIITVWIPRSIWPNKPTPIEHWLIRKYENVSAEFSASLGFMGTLKADFGWFSLFFAFLIGIFLRYCDRYINLALTSHIPSLSLVFALTLIPFIFFFVRSPITGTITLGFIYIVYYIIRSLFFKLYTDETSPNKLNG